MESYEFVVVGGGLIGSALGYGLAHAGHRTIVLDEGDVAHRASRGNFGLIWVQGKGLGMPSYSDWSRLSSQLWLDLAPELHELTGIDVAHERRGGIEICTTEEDMRRRRAALNALHEQTEGRFRFEMLDHKALAELIPAIGPDVAGASWSAMDGHVNPLHLLRALQEGLQRHGGIYRPSKPARRIVKTGTTYRVECSKGNIHGERVVLAAGLGNRALAPQVGLIAPLIPNRGELLITERVAPMLNLPTAYVRQTREGTLQLGDSHEDVGMDDGTRNDVLVRIARGALRDFPRLADVRIVRSWGCLRVMTPDGFPVYEESPTCPGTFMVSCHSGVTLAAVHAKRLVPWLLGDDRPAETLRFTTDRFDVPTPATA